MENQFSRTETLIGTDALKKLAASRVAVFGVGGVGGYIVEALARAGVGNIDLIDNDDINVTNINRQIIALQSTVGQSKVEVAKSRILDINPQTNVTTHKKFFSPETSGEFDFSQYDYVVDAIDSVTGKIELVLKSREANSPIISCMGTGNKLHPEMFEIADIYKTSVCPLAKVMRTELKKRGIKKLKVLYSKETPIKQAGQRVPASISFVPPVAGLIIAGEVIRDLIQA
jgi:tRNA A37 threonylcarbamoyladenosine dehydratase